MGVGGAMHDGLVKSLGAEVNGAALTIAVDVVQAWAVVLTLGFTIILIFFLAFCICSKKDDSYDEYDDYVGIRTVRVFHHPHDGGENGLLTDQTSQASSRGTAKRELPAIPGSGSTTLTHAQGDTEVQPHTTGHLRPVGGVQVLPTTAAPPFPTHTTTIPSKARVCHSPQASEVGPSTSSTVSSELATRHTSHSSFGSGPVKEHQYAHLQPTKEHPYAKVGSDTDTDNYEDPLVVGASRGVVSDALLQKAAPNELSVQTTTRSPSVEIQASSAIAGHTPANEELPYITPKITESSSTRTGITGLSQLGDGFVASSSSAPVTSQMPRPDEESQQQHFSGDSQDSRGYTSISVREPLAALKAGQSQPSAVPSRLQQQEGYYMTVSDDSADETYACIYERSGGGSITTQTYAQIQPVLSPSAADADQQSNPPSHLPLTASSHSAVSGGMPVEGGPSPSALPDHVAMDPPAPPSVDSLKHVLHSRQASAGSTSGVVSSPGCEKRVASRGSPLPPLPSSSLQHYYEEAVPPPPPPPPSATSPPQSGSGSPHKSPVTSAPHSPRPEARALEDMYAKVMKKRGSTDAAASHDSSVSRGPAWHIVGIASGIPAHPEPGYETVKDFGDQNYPAYETVREGPRDPGYETVRNKQDDSEPGYETVRGKRDEDLAEPGYETVASRSSDAIEPGYETVRGQDYETVSRLEQSSEPGYETVSSRESEPGYEQVQSARKTPSECDSNYEQLKFYERPDPGYEQVAARTDSIQQVEESVVDYESERQQVTQMSPLQAAPLYSEVTQIQPLYASVKKKSPEEKVLAELEQPEAERDYEPPVVDLLGSSEVAGEEEEAEQPVVDTKCRRSIEEEAAYIVSHVEETAISILSSREKLNATAEGQHVQGSDGSSDTSSDAVFSRCAANEQSPAVPGLITTDASQDGGSDTTSCLTKKDSGSVETENGGRDTNKASIEVQNGSAHSSVDNSSSGREDDISPEDEVCLPPPGSGYDEVEDVCVPRPVLVSQGGEEVTPMTPTVLSIPVPQSSSLYTEESSVSPPHATLLHDLPETDQVREELLLNAVAPPSDSMEPPVLPPPLEESGSFLPSSAVLPPDLLMDAPECDLLPPLDAPILDPGQDVLPPPMECDLLMEQPAPASLTEDEVLPPPSPTILVTQDLPPPPMLPLGAYENGDEHGYETEHEAADSQEDDDDEDGGKRNITVIVNPMAEIDELASRVAKACRDDPSPVTSPSDADLGIHHEDSSKF